MYMRVSEYNYAPPEKNGVRSVGRVVELYSSHSLDIVLLFREGRASDS